LAVVVDVVVVLVVDLDGDGDVDLDVRSLWCKPGTWVALQTGHMGGTC